MANLTLHLAEGFDNDTVEIRVNGETVFNKKNVNTSDLVGLADSVSAEVDTVAADIDVFLPTHGLSQSFRVEARDSQDVVISVVGGRIDWSAPESPVGFA